MSNEVPKEQMSAYQRWELSSFDKPSSAKPQETKPAFLPPSQETIDLIKEEARLQGLNQGLEEGRAQGLAEARARADQDAARFDSLLDSLSSALEQTDKEVADTILKLSFDIAKAMVRSTLAVNNDAVLELIRDCLRDLSVVQKPATIYVNPQDLSMVTTHLNQELTRDGWLVRDDAEIERGGCRVETATNFIDATLGTRWSKIALALGVEENSVDK